MAAIESALVRNDRRFVLGHCARDCARVRLVWTPQRHVSKNRAELSLRPFCPGCEAGKLNHRLWVGDPSVTISRMQPKPHRTALEIGVRVLAAVVGRSALDPADVVELRRFAPELEHLPVDQLACEVINRCVAYSKMVASD